LNMFLLCHFPLISHLFAFRLSLSRSYASNSFPIRTFSMYFLSFCLLFVFQSQTKKREQAKTYSRFKM
jgi:hypothetical protein